MDAELGIRGRSSKEAEMLNAAQWAVFPIERSQSPKLKLLEMRKTTHYVVYGPHRFSSHVVNNFRQKGKTYCSSQKEIDRCVWRRCVDVAPVPELVRFKFRSGNFDVEDAPRSGRPIEELIKTR
ncbi:hypothetical protein TNCV_1809041 [Trichonephila clavipes]|nr:hypothetical protein TNCV_1809041 [Trichonephila clavipes]